MPRLGIGDLPLPKRRYRPDLAQHDFETRAAAHDEDVLRAKKLRSGSRRRRVANKHALRLARRLERSSSSSRPYPSLASSAYCRSLRRRVIGAVWQLVDQSSHFDCKAFTVACGAWIYAAADLGSINPGRLLAGLRQDLLRVGASNATGALIICLHGEFEPETEHFIIHVHGLALGDMIEVVDRLRRRPKFKPVPRGPNGRPGIRTPVQIRRKPLYDMPRGLTYLLKPYWPAKRVGSVGSDGRIKRSRNHSRIPEPFHSDLLLWMDRLSLGDITLIMGVRVSSHGLRLTSQPGGAR